MLLLQRLLHANVTLNDSPLSGMITASGEYGVPESIDYENKSNAAIHLFKEVTL